MVARHAEPAPRLCNKDPFTLKSGTYLRQVLPYASKSTIHTNLEIYSAVPQWEVHFHGTRWQSHSSQHHNKASCSPSFLAFHQHQRPIVNLPDRKVTITGFDLKSYRQCLQKWNAAITAMNEQCDQLGCPN